jgi:plastocyanin
MPSRCAQALLLLAAAGCGTSPGSMPEAAAPVATAAQKAAAPAGVAAPAESAQVVIDNFAFQPATLTVTAGTKVTWVNRDDVPHTATSSARPRAFASGTLDTDDRFSRVFATPGTYPYFCAVHPHMTGKIVVK